MMNSQQYIHEEDQEQMQIHLGKIQLPKKQGYSYLFTPPQHPEIQQGIYNKIPLEKLIKFIHQKYSDPGLVSTLIHRIYQSNNNQIEYYVPEMVYIAIKKQNKQMKKVLVKKASVAEGLRRLILWNVKAFTVLMKQKDPQLRIFVQNFEKELVISVVDKKKFQESEKAIAMLTTASLILKKIPKEDMKPKLKKFIKRFNYEILNNNTHVIMIPFRSGQSDIFKSNYVVRIIEDNCSCFPTRKRVPYRIIMQTIDNNQIKNHPTVVLHSRNNKKPQPDENRDLFQQVSQEIEKLFRKEHNMTSFLRQGQYPFVVDQQEFATIRQLSKFAKKIENDEKDQEKSIIKKSNLKVLRRDTLKSRYDNNGRQKDNFQIKDNDQLRKYDAIYIPTLPSNMRKSQADANEMRRVNQKNQHTWRWTSKQSEEDIDDVIKIWEQQPMYNGLKVEQVWGQPWEITVKKLRQASPYKKFASLKFHNVVIKGGDDLRQEIICMQLIYKIQAILKEANLDIFIKPYQIIVLSQNSGLLEFVDNSMSVDGIKKERKMDIPQFYLQVFNTQSKFLEAKAKFIRSLAGSSILTYVLRLKDRHNGNILIDKDGNIIHIDFGFIFGMSPGGLNFQSSPFKLTQEYVILMGGKNSPDYNYFRDLFCAGMVALRKRLDEICLILEIMMQDSDLDCFMNFQINGFRGRFFESYNDQKFYLYCEGLVEKSCMNSRTAHYDTFQKLTNGIMP